VSAVPYSIRFSADPVQLTFFRFGLGRWLHSLQWPEAERKDIVLAVSEACTNSVEHAYTIDDEAGDVEVTARLVLGPDGRRVAIKVRDWGRWRSDRADPGHGLVLIQACMEHARIRHDEHGTSVLMFSRPVPIIGPQATDLADGAPQAYRQAT
jgi:anti-sigma regulatory factor (Ser/Thr protein kinase)